MTWTGSDGCGRVASGRSRTTWVLQLRRIHRLFINSAQCIHSRNIAKCQRENCQESALTLHLWFHQTPRQRTLLRLLHFRPAKMRVQLLPKEYAMTKMPAHLRRRHSPSAPKSTQKQQRRLKICLWLRRLPVWRNHPPLSPDATHPQAAPQQHFCWLHPTAQTKRLN